MEILQSNNIPNEQFNFANQDESINVYDGLTTPISHDVLTLTRVHKHQIEAFAQKALVAYAPLGQQPEQTLAHRKHGIPTLIARVDCTMQYGAIKPYELEDSPSGMGITDLITKRANGIGIKEAVLSHYNNTLGDIPHIVVSGSRTHGTDDKLIFGQKNYHFELGSHHIPARINGNAVIVKAIPGSPESHTPYIALSKQAVAPLLSEGDKTYAERIQLLQAITRESQFLRDSSGEISSQVLKSRLGSMALGVAIYLSPSDRKEYGKRGTTTYSQLNRKLNSFVERDGSALIQEHIPAVQVKNEEGRSNMILRVFVAAKRHEQKIHTEVIGGCYVARPELIVHGSTNSVAGAILVE